MAEIDQAETDDDVTTSDLVFVAEPPAARVSDRTPAITLDDDTLTISMSDDDAPDETEDHASAGPRTTLSMPWRGSITFTRRAA